MNITGSRDAEPAVAANDACPWASSDGILFLVVAGIFTVSDFRRIVAERVVHKTNPAKSGIIVKQNYAEVIVTLHDASVPASSGT